LQSAVAVFPPAGRLVAGAVVDALEAVEPAPPVDADDEVEAPPPVAAPGVDDCAPRAGDGVVGSARDGLPPQAVSSNAAPTTEIAAARHRPARCRRLVMIIAARPLPRHSRGEPSAGSSTATSGPAPPVAAYRILRIAVRRHPP
jgi:hypothetical protein